MWGVVDVRGGHEAGHEAERGPHLKYPCRDPDEIYELYDDVEPTDDSRSSPRSRGLLVAGPGTWDTSVAREFSAMLLV